MVNHQASESSLDTLILQVFEDQEDKFSFPLTTQKQTRDFVRLLNHRGFTYEMLSDEIGEKSEVFRSWRLGSGPDSIGRRMMSRLNKPIQEAMSCDVETEEERILCNGLVEDSRTVGSITNEPEQSRIQLTKEAEASKEKAEPVIDKAFEPGKAARISSETGSRKCQGEDGKASSEVKKSSEGISSQPLLDSKADKPKEETSGPKAASEITNGSSVEKHPVEESDNRKQIETKEVSGKCLSKSNINVTVKKTEPDSEQSSSGSKRKQEDEASTQTDKSTDLKTGGEESKDTVDSKTTENLLSETAIDRMTQEPSDRDRDRETNKAEDKRRDKPNDNVGDDDPNKCTATEVIEEHRKKATSENQDERKSERLSELSLTEKTAERVLTSGDVSTSNATSAVPLPSSHKQTLLLSTQDTAASSPALLSLNPSMNKTVSQHPRDASSKEQTAATPIDKENSEEVKNSSTKDRVSSPSTQHSHTTITRDEKVKQLTDIGPEKRSLLQPNGTMADSVAKDQSNRAANINRSLSDSSAKESGSSAAAAAAASGAIKSPQTAPTSPSIPVATGTSTPTGALPTAVDESYDSDLDPENKDHSAQEMALIEKLRLLKGEENQDSPGYLFVFSDTPSATGTGKHRVRIGVSRFPAKKFQQALLFNPDIRVVMSIAVDRRKSALRMVQDELRPMSLRGKRDWYWGSLEVVLTTIRRLFPKEDDEVKPETD